ncbi:MAG: metallophosphoesterase [Bordetella sp.]|nr:metallophosphoesterase [Pseudomonadota bacterium]MDQ8018261.1 metallophosphoesterase [Pseudomonadota bacterium]
MTVLVQISDPHFGTEQPPVVRALADWVRAQAPDVLLLTGDITQRATAAQFAAARAFVDALGVAQCLTVPGNHDIPLFALWARLFAPYRRYAAAFGAELAPVVERPDCLVLGLNTTRWWRHENGEVSPRQIEDIARRLGRASPAQLRIVAVHQPVAVTRPEDRKNLLRGHAALVRQASQAGADLVLGGHIHLPYALRLPTGRAAWAVQAGTAVSSRVRAGAPNSVNLIRGPVIGVGGARSCTLERWDHDARTGRFEPAQVRTLELSPMPTGPSAASSNPHAG